MDKKEYDQIEERANKLQNEAERKCSQKIKEATEYKDGYVQGVEDLLTAIRRGGVKDESKKNAIDVEQYTRRTKSVKQKKSGMKS